MTTKVVTNLKDYGIKLTKDHVRLLEKYHSSTALYSVTGARLALKAQTSLMKDICQMTEDKYEQKRLQEEMV